MSSDAKTFSFQLDKGELPPSEIRPANVTRQEWRRKQREAKAASRQKGLMVNGLQKQPVPTIALVNCPKCNKRRLGKYLGEDNKPFPVSNETIEVRGETRLVDVCGFCDLRYRESDRKFIMDNLKKIQKAMRERRLDPTSHKDFSIDL